MSFRFLCCVAVSLSLFLPFLSSLSSLIPTPNTHTPGDNTSVLNQEGTAAVSAEAVAALRAEVAKTLGSAAAAALAVQPAALERMSAAAVALRAFVRVKIADAADLAQARTAVEGCAHFFALLRRRAGETGEALAVVLNRL